MKVFQTNEIRNIALIGGANGRIEGNRHIVYENDEPTSNLLLAMADKLGANVRFSWLRSANSGLYVVYNQLDERAADGIPTGRELIVKYSYIFDVFH